MLKKITIVLFSIMLVAGFALVALADGPVRPPVFNNKGKRGAVATTPSTTGWFVHLPVVINSGNGSISPPATPTPTPTDIPTSTNPTCTEALFLDVQPVPSNSALPDPLLNVSCSGNTLSITTNEIPNHTTGDFPNRGNPHSISAQNGNYTLSLNPTIAGTIDQVELGQVFGILINGLVLDPVAAEYYNNDRNSGWNYNALSLNLGFDSSNAHVQPSGAYHYHGIPTELVAQTNTTGQMALVGYAADGFPIYVAGDTGDARSSYQVKSGTRPSGPGGEYDGTFVEDYEYVAGAGNLDQCNGRFGSTPEYPEGIYHYYLTVEFPHIPRCYVGTPDASFSPGGGPPR